MREKFKSRKRNRNWTESGNVGQIRVQPRYQHVGCGRENSLLATLGVLTTRPHDPSLRLEVPSQTDLAISLGPSSDIHSMLSPRKVLIASSRSLHA